MADDKQEVKRVEHKNIFDALAAFQGENPEIKKTKRFGKEGEKMTFMYAPLDEFVAVVRPLTSKHGLSFVWEGAKTPDGKPGLVCALYHETYEVVEQKDSEIVEPIEDGAGSGLTSRKFTVREKNVVRSMPVEVKRSGDMKTVGGDSTYARRYTLAEVLGIAAEEDTDVGILEGRVGQLEGFAMQKAREGIENAKTDDALKKQIDFFDADLALIEQNKKTKLGLKKEQYEELIKLAGAKRNALREGKDIQVEDAPETPGENPADTTGEEVA